MDDRESLEQGYEIERAIMASDLRPTLVAVQAVIDEAAMEDPRAKGTRPEEYVDFRFVDRLAADIAALPDGRVRVDFAAPQRAMTPGQAAVAYVDDQVVGGGTIESAGE